MAHAFSFTRRSVGPRIVVVVAVTALLAALSVFAPLVAAALAVVACAVLVAWGRTVGALGRELSIATVVTAIAGPNLALPSAPGLFAFRVVIVLLLVGVLAHLAIGGSIPWPRALSLPASLFGLMVMWAVISLSWADLPREGLRWIGLLALGVALSLTIAVAFSTRDRMIQLLKVLGVVFVVVVGVSLMELVLGIRLPTSRLLNTPADTAFAATSFFGNENNLATYLTLTLPYFVGLVIVFRDIRLRAIGAAGVLTTLLLLLYTGSKTNLLVTALVFLTFFVVLAVDRSMRRQAFLGALALGAAAALVLVPALNGVGPIKLSDRALNKFSFSLLTQQVDNGVGSGAVRASLTHEGLGLVRDTGGIGAGAGNSSAALAERIEYPEVVLLLHNWWLEVAADLGLIGLSLYICVYLFMVTHQLRAARSHDPLLRYLGLAGTAALVGFVVGSLAPSSALAFSPMWITFGVCLATTVLLSATRGRQP